MGKKKRLIMKRRRFGRKFANHPALKSRVPAAEVPAPVAEVPVPVVEQVPEEPLDNAYVSTTDDADLLLALFQEVSTGEPAPEVPAPVVKKPPVKRKTTKRRTTTKRTKRTTVKKDK